MWMTPAAVGRSASYPDKQAAVRVQLHDLPVLNQDGKSLRFKSDVIGDRLIAITFTYTICTTICPILDSIFVKLQDKLGDRLNRDIFMATVSIDPVNDIPPRLKSYAVRLKAKPGWNFLTGNKVNVDKVLTGLDMYSADILNHTPSILIGDGKTGVWRRFYGFPSADKLLASLNELSAARLGK
jgi:protein SCO1/2